MTTPMLLPADFDRDDFLRHYWQKKPLLIRAANRDFRDPIEPDELAGLACQLVGVAPDLQRRLAAAVAAA